MKAVGHTQSSLARAVGIKQPSINRVIHGETQNPRRLHDIAAALQTTVDYLLGKTDDPDVMEFRGSPSDFAELVNAAQDRKIAFQALTGDDTVEVAEIDPRFGLGGAFMDDHAVPEMRKFSRAWLRQITASPPDQLYWARGRGDSMEPAISDGDVCLIDRTETSPERFGDTYWAIAYGQTGMIKRLRPMPDGSVKILSNNPHVPPETAYEGELHVFGRVVAVVKKV